LIAIPKALWARSFLLIMVLIVLSLASSIAIFRHVEQEPRAKQMAQLVVAVVNLTRAAVLSAAPEWRSALLTELAEAEGLRVQAAEASDVLIPLRDDRPEVNLMKEKVRKSVGENTRFAESRNGVEAFWVSFVIGGEEFWVSLPKERMEPPRSELWIARSALVLGLALLGAYFIALQVARPLKEMAQAARQVGRGETPQRLREEGATEIAEVARAFNQMSADLAAHDRERALVLGGISHDLRTPLTRIRLAAEMSGDAVLREGLNADVDQMDSVIQQFLDFARLDESETAVPTDLRVLVNEVSQRFSSLAASLELALQPVPVVPVRPLLIRRALDNLLDNAIKYGGGKIALQLRKEANAILLTVSDRGPGIPEEQHAAVKRPFIRLAASRGDASGAGLGLAIVDRAARLHGGEFRLANRPGGGLDASLVLPIAA
jgi:two-component system, OmpR family, osmolarity sensor histidine kinase EnvZ